MSKTPLITLSNVSKHYSAANQAGVSEIDLTIYKGDFVSVVGESGSGKSTLLKLIYGLLAPDSGEICFEGKHLPGPHEKLIPGNEKMKMLTQDFNLNVYARVYDNIAGMLSNEDLEAKKQETLEMMEFVGIDHLAEKRIVDLSGGEQQRVALARAIITEPEVLLLDEPFSQVDAIMKNQLRADIKRLSKYLGITIIMVSHDPQDGLSLADQMILIRKGKIIQQGKPSDIAREPVSGYVGKLLGNANVITAVEAKKYLKLSVDSAGEVLIYPHHVQTDRGAVQGTVIQVHYKLLYDELEVAVGELMLHLIVPSGKHQAGEKITLSVDNFRLLESSLT